MIRDPRYRVRYDTLDSWTVCLDHQSSFGPYPPRSRRPTGRVWFVMTDGLVWVDPTHLIRNALVPPVTIWSISSGGKQYPNAHARARRIALANGLRYVYTGNVHDAEGGGTYLSSLASRDRARTVSMLGVVATHRYRRLQELRDADPSSRGCARSLGQRRLVLAFPPLLMDQDRDGRHKGVADEMSRVDPDQPIGHHEPHATVGRLERGG